MKKSLALALALTCATLSFIPAAQAAPSQEQAQSMFQAHGYKARQRPQIEALLKRYEQALNTADAEAVTQLYTPDGVVLAQQSPTAVGLQAVHDSYVGTFQAINLNITFQIAELQVVAPDWAFLRTSSTGTIKILANGAQVPEGNQELFVLRKTNGDWKIARYSFSSVLPAAQ